MQMRASQLGQGLIESLIVVLIVGVSVVGMFKFQNYLAYNSNIAQQQADAAILAVSELETLRDYQVLNTTAGYSAYQNIASGSSTSASNNTTYTLTWTVTTTASPSYKTLDISVTWTDRIGGAQSLRLITQLAGLDPSGAAAVF